MKIIKMIKGMTVINGKQYAVGDGAFQIDDEAKAARLVQLGVALYAGGAEIKTSSNDDSENNSNDNDEDKGNDIDSMSYNELKEKATELGIVYPGKKKADLIAEIKAALAGGNDNGDADDNDAPTFAPEGNIQ